MPWCLHVEGLIDISNEITALKSSRPTQHNNVICSSNVLSERNLVQLVQVIGLLGISKETDTYVAATSMRQQMSSEQTYSQLVQVAGLLRISKEMHTDDHALCKAHHTCDRCPGPSPACDA